MTKEEAKTLIKKHERAIELLDSIKNYRAHIESLENSKNGFSGEILGKAYFDKKIVSTKRLLNIIESKYKKLF